jgi:hypothetical protein
MFERQGMREQHAVHSVLRERIIEHLIVGKLLRRLWAVGNTSVEILRSEFDRGGYDLVADFGSVTRHIQLKCSRIEGDTREQTVSLNLSAKASGCIVWIIVDDDLNFQHFLWFGSAPGEPLPDIHGMPVAKHSKGDSKGVKLERPNLRKVPKNEFQLVESVDELLDRLLGPSWQAERGLSVEV